jgi:hypothetical protein
MTDTNTTHPGLPNYTGPTEGWAAWVHHDVHVEYCYSFAERIKAIKKTKLQHEQAVRLAALTVIPETCVPAQYVQAWQAWQALVQARRAWDQTWDAYEQAWQGCVQAQWACRPQLLALVAQYVDQSLWNDKGLVFPESKEQP